DIRQELGRDLERLGARRGGAHDVDVALEAEQLREVVAGLRDVVDDQDADLVGHRAVQGLWVAGDFMDSMVLVWRMRFVLSRSEAGRRARDRLVRRARRVGSGRGEGRPSAWPGLRS